MIFDILSLIQCDLSGTFENINMHDQDILNLFSNIKNIFFFGYFCLKKVKQETTFYVPFVIFFRPKLNSISFALFVVVLLTIDFT